MRGEEKERVSGRGRGRGKGRGERKQKEEKERGREEEGREERGGRGRVREEKSEAIFEISVLFNTVLCCGPVAILASCVLPSFCLVVATFAFEVSGQEMGSDGFQTQKSKSWIPGKQRAEKVLADAITIDGRKEWTCKLCSESNVWTRWRCRRCYSNISTGLRGSADRRFRREVVGGRQDHCHQVVEKKRSPETRMQRLKSFERKLNSSEGSREGGGRTRRTR